MSKKTKEQQLPEEHTDLSTSLKIAEQELAKLKEENKELKNRINSLDKSWTALFQETPMGVEIVDKEGTIIDCNPTMEILFDFKKEELIAHKINLFTGLSYPDYIKEAFFKHKELHTVFDYDFNKDKHYSYFASSKANKIARIKMDAFPILDKHNNLEKYISFFNILTEESSIKLELMKAKAIINRKQIEARTILDALHTGIMLVNNEGTILDINTKYEQLFSIDRYNFYSKKMKLKDRPCYLPEMGDALLNKKSFNCEFWFHTNTDNPEKSYICKVQEPDSIYLRYEGASIKNSNKQQIAYLIFFREMTQEQTLLETVKEAKEKAEMANQLKSAFLANMSHEIRTPLNSIIGFSDLLCTEEVNAEDKADYADIIHQNNELLLRVINDVLDLSLIESGMFQLDPQHFNVKKVVEDIHDSFLPKAKRHELEFTLQEDGKDCTVFLDKNRFAQVLINFVSNAIKYTPKGGKIAMHYQARPNGIYIGVTDNGIGIDKDKQDKVFQRFEKLDNFAQGTGLGLSICKAIVEKHKGEIGFESQEKNGSTFWAFIPCEITY